MAGIFAPPLPGITEQHTPGHIDALLCSLTDAASGVVLGPTLCALEAAAAPPAVTVVATTVVDEAFQNVLDIVGLKAFDSQADLEHAAGLFCAQQSRRWSAFVDDAADADTADDGVVDDAADAVADDEAEEDIRQSDAGPIFSMQKLMCIAAEAGIIENAKFTH